LTSKTSSQTQREEDLADDSSEKAATTDSEFTPIVGTNLLDTWQQTLRRVQRGPVLEDPWRSKEVREVPNMTIVCKNPPSKEDLPEVFQASLTEAQNRRLLEAFFIKSYWPPSFNFNRIVVKNKGGEQTQYQRVLDLLDSNPKSRRGTISLIYPEQDFPRIEWPPTVKTVSKHHDFPAICAMDFKIRNELFLTAMFRSLEVYFWLPVNLIQLGAVLDDACKKLRRRKGLMTFFTTSAHYYRSDEKRVKSALKLRPKSVTPPHV
jgi:thymidylate synthase